MTILGADSTIFPQAFLTSLRECTQDYSDARADTVPTNWPACFLLPLHVFSNGQMLSYCHPNKCMTLELHMLCDKIVAHYDT